MTGNNAKIEKFILDYFRQVNSDSDIKKNEHIYNILTNCSYFSENNILDKEMFTLYFTNEQLDKIEAKQEELGYEGNFSRFVRYALFNFYMKEHDMALHNKFLGELIDFDRFKLLCDKCKDKLLFGKYTSYDIDLLRDNKKYEGKISFSDFNNKIKGQPLFVDFLEFDMLAFLSTHFKKGKVYSDLMGLSTKQFLCNEFVKTENGDDLELFIDYDNIVPNIDDFYYLFLYYAFIIDPGELDTNEIFDETDEHIDLLLKKYSFGKIVKHFKEKYNMLNTYDIFDKKCIEILLSDNVMTTDDIIEIENTIEPNDIIASDEIIESNERAELTENINTKL